MDEEVKIDASVPLPHHYAFSHEPESRKLWDEDDMRDYAAAVLNSTLVKFENELSKQRDHFFKLQDPRAESIWNTLVVVHEALKAALSDK